MKWRTTLSKSSATLLLLLFCDAHDGELPSNTVGGFDEPVWSLWITEGSTVSNLD